MLVVPFLQLCPLPHHHSRGERGRHNAQERRPCPARPEPCGLPQVDPKRLMHALTTRTRVIRDEALLTHLDAVGAAESRDALAKTLYAKLFDWLVAAINRKIPSYGERAPV